MARRRSRRRRRNKRNLIVVDSSSEVPAAFPIYPHDIPSAPVIFSASLRTDFPLISPVSRSLNMAATVTALPSVDATPGTRTVETTRNGLRIQVENPVEEGVDDDVVYLYSVSGGQLVEVVDLAENAQNQEQNSSTRNFILETERTPIRENTTNRNSTILQDLSERDVSVICISHSKDATEKPVVRTVAPKKRKRCRSSGEARCSICDTNYEGIANAGGELFSSRCGHLFCMSCLRTLDPYKCTDCNKKISNLWKIYL